MRKPQQLCNASEVAAYRARDSLLKLLQVLKQLVQGQLAVFFSGGRQSSLAPLPQLLTAVPNTSIKGA